MIVCNTFFYNNNTILHNFAKVFELLHKRVKTFLTMLSVSLNIYTKNIIYYKIGMNTIRDFLKNKQLLLLIAFLPTSFLHAQKVGIKTNTLYLATTTPNLGIEVATSNSFTLSLTAGYNPFSFPSRENTDGRKIHPKLKHWLIMPEVKYWFCKSFQRGYLGLHGIYADYNIGGFPKPRVFDDTRYKGQAYGGGLSYGYQWAIGDRWGMEASADSISKCKITQFFV